MVWSRPQVSRTTPGRSVRSSAFPASRSGLHHLNPQAEHLLDWFHLTMRITVMTQLAKGMRVPPELSAALAAELQRLKWFLWHGNVFRSLQTVDDIAGATAQRLGPCGAGGSLASLVVTGRRG